MPEFKKIKFDPAIASRPISQDEYYPGINPYSAGPYASMYLGQPWTIRQYAGFSTASDSNVFYKANLKAGQKGLSVAFDLATHRGYDSDHPRVKGDVGKAGVAIDTVEDMDTLFDGIPLDQVSVSMTMNGAVIPIMAFYIVTAMSKGIHPSLLSGTIQNDILKEFLVRNTYIYPPAESMRLVTDIFKYTSLYMPRFNAISVSGYHMLEAGAPPYLELAFTLADGYEYLRYGKKAGLNLDDFAPRISFFFGIGMNLLIEVAKLKAARILWAGLVEKAGAMSEKSKLLRMHCQTSGWSLTAHDIDNNIGRTAIEALAAILGGTQSLHTNSMDEAVGLPTVETAAIARDTQLIFQQKIGIENWTDILSGSHCIENLVRELVENSQKIIAEIEEMGGMTNAISMGYPKRKIEECAALKQAKIDSGEEKIIGLNLFKPNLDENTPVLQIDHNKVLAEQIERIARVRTERNEKATIKTLKKIERACRDNKHNILAAAIEAATANATLGEISSAIENVYGRYQAPLSSTINIYGSKSMKNKYFAGALRAVHVFEKKQGRRPRILIAKLGQDGHDRGAKIIATGFADLGFDVDIGPLFQTPVETAKQAIENDVHFIGISTLAGAHKILIQDLMVELKKYNRMDIALIAGGIIPVDDYNELYKMGVLAIFGSGTNLAEAAIKILKLMK